MRAALFVCVTGIGCGEPISNQVFLEEAVFFGALPGVSRFGAPRNVLLAPNGDASVLATAKIAAALWDDRFRIAVDVGEQLRKVEPDEVTAVKRAWTGVNVVTRLTTSVTGLPAGVYDYYATASILMPQDQDAVWSIGLALRPKDEPVTVLTGTHRAIGGTGSGTLFWDIGETVVTLGGTPSLVGTLEASYDDLLDDGNRHVVGALTPLIGYEAPFGLTGDQVLGFASAEFSLTDDGYTWPGYANVLHDEGGGFAKGVLVTSAAEVPFSSCWNGDGGLVWQSGEQGIAAVGLQSACPVADPF